MPLNDPTVPVPESETLDTAAIDACLKAHLPTLRGTPTIRKFPRGASNLTYLLAYPERDLVLRRPPLGHIAPGAHNMTREYGILEKLNGVFSHSPQPVLLCTDHGVTGTDFYVMERLRGLVPGRDLPPALGLDPAKARALCEGFIDCLVELHRVDYRACGLAGLGKPQGYIARQVQGWTERYQRALMPAAPSWAAVIAWLHDKMPTDTGRVSLVHNDYRLDNVVLDPCDPTRIIGVLDWELAALGDPLMDLGNCLAYWVQRADPVPVQYKRCQPSNAPGMLTRSEILAYYAERSGLAIGNFDFYYVHGLFRLGAIIQQIYCRYREGERHDPRFAQFLYINALLEQMSLQVIEGSTL